MTTITIKDRWNDVIWEGEAETTVDALRQAIREEKSLRWANLTGANLTHADLTRVNLTRADLTRANLTDANLTRANLTDANLTGANLTGANLTDANLTRANTALARADIRSILTAAPAEVAGLKAALLEGRVNGSVYSGTCACLIGTIANVRHCEVYDLGVDHPELKANSWRPAERWFLAIRQGMAPTHPIVALTLAWIDQWEQDARAAALVYGGAK